MRSKKNKIFIPFENCARLIEQSHCTWTRHLQTAKLFLFLSQHYYWFNMFKDIKNVVDSYEICAKFYP